MSGTSLVILGSVLTVVGATTVVAGNLALWLWLNLKNSRGGKR